MGRTGAGPNALPRLRQGVALAPGAPEAVDPGPLVGELRVIRSGLTAKDQVIISGVQRARPGQKVQPQKGAIKQTAGATAASAPAPRTPRASSAEIVAAAQK